MDFTFTYLDFSYQYLSPVVGVALLIEGSLFRLFPSLLNKRQGARAVHWHTHTFQTNDERRDDERRRFKFNRPHQGIHTHHFTEATNDDDSIHDGRNS